MRYLAARRIQGLPGNEFIVKSSKATSPSHVVKLALGNWTCMCKKYARLGNCGGVEGAILYLATSYGSNAHQADRGQVLPAQERVGRCRFCGSMDSIKMGIRPTKAGQTQRYLCRACNRRFTEIGLLSYLRATNEAVMLAVQLHFEGNSFRKSARLVSQAFALPVTKSTVERWVSKIGLMLADYWASLRPKLGPMFHADETTVKVKTAKGAKWAWAWNVMDRETRILLANNVTIGKDTRHAIEALRKARTAAGGSPPILVTDGAHTYKRGVSRALRNKNEHTTHIVYSPMPPKSGKKGAVNHGSNNILERLNRTQRGYTRPRDSFGSLDSARRRMDAWRAYVNLLRPHEALDGRTPAQAGEIHHDLLPGDRHFDAVLWDARLQQLRSHSSEAWPGEVFS